MYHTCIDIHVSYWPLIQPNCSLNSVNYTNLIQEIMKITEMFLWLNKKIKFLMDNICRCEGICLDCYEHCLDCFYHFDRFDHCDILILLTFWSFWHFDPFDILILKFWHFDPFNILILLTFWSFWHFDPFDILIVLTFRLFCCSALEVVIWMRDRVGIHVTLECGGHDATAKDLFEVAVEQRGLPQDCDNIFSIWLVSPLLGKDLTSLLSEEMFIL